MRNIESNGGRDGHNNERKRKPRFDRCERCSSLINRIAWASEISSFHYEMTGFDGAKVMLSISIFYESCANGGTRAGVRVA